MSWYLTIRPDPSFSRATPVGPLVEYLLTLPELVQAGPQEFRNPPGSPWAALCFSEADGAGNYAVRGDLPPAVNVVVLVCGDGGEEWYESLALRVAAFLGWEVVEEHTGRTIHPAR